MKSMAGIEKRLAAVAKKNRKGSGICLEFKSPIDSLAYVLSGNMLKNDPEVIELVWDNASRAGGAIKINMLKPYMYHPEQLDEVRREWKASPYERDRVALLELDRLLPAVGV